MRCADATIQFSDYQLFLLLDNGMFHMQKFRLMKRGGIVLTFMLMGIFFFPIGCANTSNSKQPSTPAKQGHQKVAKRNHEEYRAQLLENPYLVVRLSTPLKAEDQHKSDLPVERSMDWVKIKKNRKSLVNRLGNLDEMDWQSEFPILGDDVYFEFQALIFKILRNPRPKISHTYSTWMTVSAISSVVAMKDGKLMQRHNLKQKKCTFDLDLANDADARELYELFYRLLDKYVPEEG